MAESRSWYAQFAVAVLVANLLVGLLDGDPLNLALVIKAAAVAVLATLIAALWNRRRRSRAE